MTSVRDGFIDEWKSQALKDLQAAEILLRHEGPLEHVGYLSEQAFEKTIKYVYAYYKVKIKNETIDSVYDKMKHDSHLGSTNLTLNMLREYYVETYRIVIRHINEGDTLPDPLKAQMKVLFEQAKIDGAGFFERMFDDAIHRIRPILRKREDYVIFLKHTNAESFTQFMKKFDFDERIDELVTSASGEFKKVVTPQQVSGGEFFISPLFHQKQFRFIMNVLGLCRYVLPYAEMTRYPLKECNYENLKLFEQLDPQLRPYFNILLKRLKELVSQSDEYILTLVAIFKTVNK